jgi:NAD(P)-dependent dehydrogenase (short-subunit alcohol dehydrogenase family)
MDRLKGKIILVTGANSGIGFAVAQACVLAEAQRVIVAGRSAERVNAAVAKLGSRAVGEVVDQASLASIDAFAARVSKSHPVIDVLFDNAGVANPPHGFTPDGFQTTLGTNTIGSAYLTSCLLPQVAASRTGRIIITSSWYAAECSPRAFAARLQDVGGRRDAASAMDLQYNQSKALQTMWAEALQLKLRAAPGTAHVLVASVNPGAVATSVFDAEKVQPSCFMWFVRNFASKLICVPADKGAMPLLACATAPEVADNPGAMFGAAGPANAGFKAQLFKLPGKLFTSANRDAAFEAINAAIVSTGRKAI